MQLALRPAAEVDVEVWVLASRFRRRATRTLSSVPITLLIHTCESREPLSRFRPYLNTEF